MSFPTIIIDTREQQPWKFPNHTTAVKKLDTGDYSLEGLENVLCIERKKNTSEFAKNIIEKRYDDWTMRMAEFKHKYLLLECSLADVYRFPEKSGIPKYLLSKTRISSKFLIKKLLELQILHNIHVLFCDSSYTASKIAEDIMYRVYKNEQE